MAELHAKTGSNLDPGYLFLKDGSHGYSKLRREYTQSVHLLMGLVVVVFLVTCANLASLLFVRGVESTGETSVWVALGASRQQVIRQWMTEYFLLACIGGVTGLLLSQWITDLLLLSVDEANRAWLQFEADATVILLSIGLTVAGGLLFGFLPALRASRVGIQQVMKENTSAAMGHRRSLAPFVLAGQIGATLVLVLAALLLGKTLWNLSHTPAGFETQGLAWGHPEFFKIHHPRDEITLLVQEALERLRNSPQIASASMGYALPFEWGISNSSSVMVDGYELAPGEPNIVRVAAVAPDYFGTVGIPLLRGRDFEERDRLPDAPPVAIVNERFARHYFADRNPVGQVFKPGSRSPQRIIGVVANSKSKSLREEPVDVAYYPVGLRPYPPILARGKPGVDASAVEAEIRAALRSVHEHVPIWSGTMPEAVNKSSRQERLVTSLAVAFGMLGILLAAIGLYGVTAHTLQSRRREIGLRRALGADTAAVLRLMLRQSFLITLAGIAIGLAFAIAAGRFIESLLFGVTATDPVLLGASAAIVAVVGIGAALWPALRAAKLDPSHALRCE